MLKKAAQVAKEHNVSAGRRDYHRGRGAGTIRKQPDRTYELRLRGEQFEDMIRSMVKNTLVLADKADRQCVFGIKTRRDE